MFHHRSCGAAQLVALMAAHRSAHRDATDLRQQEITRVTELLQPPQGGPAPRPRAAPRGLRPAAAMARRN